MDKKPEGIREVEVITRGKDGVNGSNGINGRDGINGHDGRDGLGLTADQLRDVKQLPGTIKLVDKMANDIRPFGVSLKTALVMVLLVVIVVSAGISAIMVALPK